MAFFDTGSGVHVCVSAGGGTCRIKAAKKGEKFDRVAAQMQLHSWICTVALLNSCTVGHLHCCTVAKLQSCTFPSWTVGVALPCDPIPSRDPGNQVELIATLAIKLASSESNLDFSNQLLLIVDF